MSETEIDLRIGRSDFIQILLALEERELHLERVFSTTQDEDESADAGNDLLSVKALLERLRKASVNKWGIGGGSTRFEVL